MSDMGGMAIGVFLISVCLGFVAGSLPARWYEQARLSAKHCQAIENRHEFEKCREEFMK